MERIYGKIEGLRRHFETEERQRVPIDIENPNLPPEVRQQATELMLDHARDVLRGLGKYAIIASTAMYLQGKVHERADFAEAPGDLDVVVFDLKTMNELRERFSRMSGVTLDNRGEFRKFPGQETKILSGKALMMVADVVISYPFEIFYDTKIAREDVYRHRDVIDGLQVLSTEGLRKQYKNNLQFEKRLQQRVDDLAGYLRTNPGLMGNDEIRADVARALDMSPEDIEEFYRLDVLLAKARSAKVKDRIEKQISELLGGVKTKIAKREKNLSQLDDLRRDSFSS